MPDEPTVLVEWEDGPPDVPDVDPDDWPARGWWAVCQRCDWMDGAHDDQGRAMREADAHLEKEHAK